MIKLVKPAPANSGTEKKAAAKPATAKKALVKQASVRAAAEKKAAAKPAPEKKSPIKKTAIKPVPDNKIPSRKAATKQVQNFDTALPERRSRLSIPPIVGVGASAGGLEALEHFLKNVPEDSGIAFVVVQHLDPTCKGMLPELLQRATSMSVMQITNRMKIKPNCVYVIPPNKDLSILHGALHLLEPVEPRGLRLPVDFFLRSLAQDRRELAIGVILSGMGSDGTLGFRAIKDKAGLTLVQSPSSAKFDGMPRSALDAGQADIVAPAEELPAKILAYLNSTRLVRHPEHDPEIKSQSSLAQIVILLRERTGSDFSLYKKNTVYRRIERRMGLHQIETLSGYVRYLRENSQELDLLFKELLIGVTSFFRDQMVWDYLKKEAIPALLAAHPGGKILRAWVPACSTGEEAYSLAIVFKEALELIKPKGRFTLQIFATDLDSDAISRARQGMYPANIAADVSPERLSRFFNLEETGFRVAKEIREMVVFAPQNIIMDPPFTKLDILTCRNLLIYFGQELQNRLIPLFHFALARSGILLLGGAETIGNFTSLFAQVDAKVRLYRSLDTPTGPALDFPTKHFPVVQVVQNEPGVMLSPLNLQALADQLLLQNYSPPAVLVNVEGDILYINGRTGKYLEPAAGKANWNIHAMARDELRYQLARALKRAVRQKNTVVLENIQITQGKGEVQSCTVTVEAIKKPEGLSGMVLIVFADVAMVKPAKAMPGKRDDASAVELERAREEIQIIREEMQTSQEELTSTNEELQSTNEELQSTNEELTTSKEEMHSLNEELQTVNAELQSKVEDLSWMNNDMRNLLNSIDIATIFLDSALNVRRFTNQTTTIFNLIPGDVGRPLTDITNELRYRQLQQDAQSVLDTLVSCEKEIPARDGRWFKVRVMPYRTFEKVIDGVVITCADITAFKRLEEELRANAPNTPATSGTGSAA